MSAYLARHLQVFFATLGAMRRTPMNSINTIIIIGITLALPSMLYVVLKSAQNLSENWQGRPQISVFTKPEVTHQEADLIFQELRLHPAIAFAELISQQQALEEFRAVSGMSYEIDFLGENPLPISIVVTPNESNTHSENLLALKRELSKIEGIEAIRLDLDWTNRFNAILLAMSRITKLLSAVLAVALILIVGNTIKLLILNRRQEIEITRLVGGSNAFVRRPFLYYGVLYGFFGAILAILLLIGAAIMMHEPLGRLAALYDTPTLVHQLNAAEVGTIIFIGGFLGWLAAHWSVAQHLTGIKPH